MLRPPSLPAPWPAASSHPCARCGEWSAGIGIGELCGRCARDLERRASRIGRLTAIVTTLLLVGYLMLTLRTVSAAWHSTARIVAAVAAVAWYLLTNRIVKRIVLEWLR